MPTREFADLVSAVTETIDQVLNTDPQMLPDQDQPTDAASFASGPVHAYVLDFEKIIWHFPDAAARIIEDAV
jgi:hypothetical protein